MIILHSPFLFAFVSGLLSEIGEDNLSEVVAVAGGCGGPGVSKTDTEVLPFLVAHFPIDNPSYGGGTTGLSSNLSMYYGFGGTQSEGGSGGRFIQGMVAGAGLSITSFLVDLFVYFFTSESTYWSISLLKVPIDSFPILCKP